VNHRVTLVILAWQAWEIERPIEVRFIHDDRGTVQRKCQRIQTHRRSRPVAADVRRLRLKIAKQNGAGIEALSASQNVQDRL
jgi:hypothetical protein